MFPHGWRGARLALRRSEQVTQWVTCLLCAAHALHPDRSSWINQVMRHTLCDRGHRPAGPGRSRGQPRHGSRPGWAWWPTSPRGSGAARRRLRGGRLAAASCLAGDGSRCVRSASVTASLMQLCAGGCGGSRPALPNWGWRSGQRLHRGRPSANPLLHPRLRSRQQELKRPWQTGPPVHRAPQTRSSGMPSRDPTSRRMPPTPRPERRSDDGQNDLETATDHIDPVGSGVTFRGGRHPAIRCSSL